MCILDGRFSCTAWALSIYWVDVSHETTPCLVCWIPDITDRSTLQLKSFNLRLNLLKSGPQPAACARGRARPEGAPEGAYNDSLKLIMFY